MTARTLNVHRLVRTKGPVEEVLKFEPGVNVIVGEPNTGKTMWLRTLDYLFGDTDPVEKALSDELANIYERALAELTIDGQQMVIERRWKEAGAKTKVYVDGRAIAAKDFSTFFLDALNVPLVRIPKGNPYAQNTWPELSWRTLLRHIYRHESSWGDLALKQPEADQFAVFLQFLGAATAVFSSAYAKLVESQKLEARLEAQKENFETALADVARELIQVEEASAGFTRESLTAAMSQIQEQIATRAMQRDAAMQELRRAAEEQVAAENEQGTMQLRMAGVELDSARAQRSELLSAVEKGNERVAELSVHLRSTKEELAKLERARAAGAVLGPLRVTHCPVCDRAVNSKVAPPDACYLCHQPQEPSPDPNATTTARLDFEAHQLQEEVKELQELLTKTQQNVDRERRQLRDLEDRVSRLESLLRPVRAAAAWILPPIFGIAENEMGRLQEQLRQLHRIENAIARREVLARQLDDLRREIARLEVQVAEKEAEPEFASLGDRVTDAMTDYLNTLDERDRERWGMRTISVSVSKNSVQLLVDGRPWSTKLGANLRAYLFLAYHYAWLKLSRTEPFTYPGFVLLDFPANLGEFAISDQENYLLTPFVKLLSEPGMRGLQLIAAGRAFANLAGAHRIDLHQKWR